MAEESWLLKFCGGAMQAQTTFLWSLLLRCLLRENELGGGNLVEAFFAVKGRKGVVERETMVMGNEERKNKGEEWIIYYVTRWKACDSYGVYRVSKMWWWWWSNGNDQWFWEEEREWVSWKMVAVVVAWCWGRPYSVFYLSIEQSINRSYPGLGLGSEEDKSTLCVGYGYLSSFIKVYTLSLSLTQPPTRNYFFFFLFTSNKGNLQAHPDTLCLHFVRFTVFLSLENQTKIQTHKSQSTLGPWSL